LQDLDGFKGILQSGSETQWCKELNTHAQRLGYTKILFGLKKTANAALETAVIHSSYDETWRKKYDESGFALLDPMVQQSLTQVLPILWSERIYETAQQKGFFEEACAYGLRSGITLPLHGPRGEVGTLSFSLDNIQSTPSANDHIFETLPQLMLLKELALGSYLPYLHTANPLIKTTAELYPLSKKAIEILKWCAMGKTSWEIAQICACTEANINFHLNKARHTLGVNSRKAAAVKACSLGIINV
jgi:LuxR family quorum-sensing transcriptional regulator LasR